MGVPSSAYCARIKSKGASHIVEMHQSSLRPSDRSLQNDFLKLQKTRFALKNLLLKRIYSLLDVAKFQIVLRFIALSGACFAASNDWGSTSAMARTVQYKGCNRRKTLKLFILLPRFIVRNRLDFNALSRHLTSLQISVKGLARMCPKFKD